MTWKQLIYHVEIALQSHGIDPNTQPIDVVDVDLVLADHGHRMQIAVNTTDMPARCSITIAGNSK